MDLIQEKRKILSYEKPLKIIAEGKCQFANSEKFVISAETVAPGGEAILLQVWTQRNDYINHLQRSNSTGTERIRRPSSEWEFITASSLQYKSPFKMLSYHLSEYGWYSEHWHSKMT